MRSHTLTKEEIIRELGSSVNCGLPNVRYSEGNAYVLHSSSSVISSGGNEETKQIIRALEYFESVEAVLRGSSSTIDLEKADFCRIASQAIREKLRNE